MSVTAEDQGVRGTLHWMERGVTAEQLSDEETLRSIIADMTREVINATGAPAVADYSVEVRPEPLRLRVEAMAPPPWLPPGQALPPDSYS